MAARSLQDVIEDVRNAIQQGDYDEAITSCRRVLGQFPEFATAHRLVGEAYLEMGQFDGARDAFQETLRRDVLNIPAYVGLGAVNEDSEDMSAALAYYQIAWELDPRRRDLREHVTRVSQRQYGTEGRLNLTYAALASIHFHAGRWLRAVAEYRQALEELPVRLDLQLRLGETLWRRGDLTGAEEQCNNVLRNIPGSVTALLILADVRRSQDRTDEANELLSRARMVDPAGVLAADMVMLGLDDQADFFAVDEHPEVDEDAEIPEPDPESEVQRKYTPAPDFMSDGEPETTVEDQPVAEESVAPFDPGVDVEPFSWDEGETGVAQQPGESSPPAADASLNLDLFTDEELERARPEDEDAHGYTGLLRSLEDEGVMPFDVGDEPAAKATSWSADLPNDDLDLDFENLDDLSDENDEFIGATESSASPESTAAEFDDLESLFDDAGLEPAADASEVASARETDTGSSDARDEQMTDTGVSETAESTEADEELSFNWEEVDNEIRDAIPGELPRGYTDQLRSLDDTGVEPFEFDSDDIPFLQRQDEESATPNAERDELTPFSFEEPEETERAETTDDLDLDEVARSVEAGAADADTEDVLAGWNEDDIDETDISLEPDDTGMSDFTPGFDRLSANYWTSSPGTTGEADQSRESADANWLFDDPDDTEETEVLAPDSVDTDPVTDDFEPGVRANDLPRSIERLGVSADLFDRVRGEKERLIASGDLVSNQSLAGEQSVGVADLLSQLEFEPDNVEVRKAVAMAMVADDPAGSLEHCRWFYHQNRAFDQDLIESMGQIIERGDVPVRASAYRLLGAVHRRNGEWRQAAHHYEQSLRVSAQA